MKIDVVIPWVDGADPKIRQKRVATQRKIRGIEPESDELNGAYRYRDSGLLKYVFRSIDRFAPWVNKIYFVTDNQWPEWINFSNNRIVKVSHEDYIPKQWLPTFSSNPILLNLHRINNLSNQFILFNDDMIINKEIQPTDFFSDEHTVKDMAVYSVLPANDEFSHLLLNNTLLINKHFSKTSLLKQAPFKVINYHYGKGLLRTFLTLPWHSIAGFYNPHMPQPYLKETFEEVWKLENTKLSDSSSHAFRDASDLTDWVFRYWQIQSNRFKPQSIKFGQYYEQNEHERIRKDIENSTHSLLCINDTPTSIDESQVAVEIINALQEKFPEKSVFEI